MLTKKSILKNRCRRKARRAFTLVEMLIVIALIALVGGFVIANLGVIFDESKEQVESQKVTNLMKLPLMRYQMAMGAYPTTEEGLKVLWTAPADAGDRWRGPYVEKESWLNDAWGSPYRYQYPGAHNPRGYDVWSIGPDKTDNTADDIGNWDKPKQ